MVVWLKQPVAHLWSTSVHRHNRERAGHGRVYIGLEDDPIEPVLKHVAAEGIHTERMEWGRPTLVIRDLDQNELFFWDWPEKQSTAVEPSEAAE